MSGERVSSELGLALVGADRSIAVPQVPGIGGISDIEDAPDKKSQIAITKRTTDYSGTYLTWMQARGGCSPFLGDQGCMLKPRIIDSLAMLPPCAYPHMPASSMPSKLVNVSWTKGKNPINTGCWTPGVHYRQPLRLSCTVYSMPSPHDHAILMTSLQMVVAASLDLAAENTLFGTPQR